MPLEPLEFLSALLLWLASVPTGFGRLCESQIQSETEIGLVMKADRLGWETKDSRWLWR